MKYLKILNSTILAILGIALAQVGFAQPKQRNLEATERPVVPTNLGQPGNEAATAEGEVAGAAASDAPPITSISSRRMFHC